MKIDILKSKEKLRVVRRDNHINSFIDNIFYLLVICIYPFIAVSELTKGLNRGTVTEWMVLLVIVAFILSGFIFYSVVKINRLTRIGGLNKEQNRLLLVNAAENLGWVIQYNNKDFITLSKNWGWTSWDWGKEMTIIYDGNDMLVNCVSFGRRGLKSPFHWIANRKTINKLTAELKRLHTQADIN